MEQTQENKMGTAPVLRLIVSMSLPAVFSMLVQSLYNIVDSYFVSKVSMDALTAVSLSFPIQQLIIAMAVGTGVGVNSLVSRRLGEKRRQEADKAASHGVVLAALTWLLFAVFRPSIHRSVHREFQCGGAGRSIFVGGQPVQF